MTNDLLELIFIIDNSGSMAGLEKDTIGGFNSLIKKQKEKNATALVTTVLFNTNRNVIHHRVDINKVSKLSKKEYYVHGCTALLDAIGNTLNEIKHEQDTINKPEKTLVIITTDGMENSSREYNYEKVKRIIDEYKEKYNYEFIFLGANIDSKEESRKLGIDVDNAVDFKCDKVGIKKNYEALHCAIDSYKVSKRINPKWRKAIDDDVKRR